jgi:hypothetical protein
MTEIHPVLPEILELPAASGPDHLALAGEPSGGQDEAGVPAGSCSDG